MERQASYLRPLPFALLLLIAAFAVAPAIASAATRYAAPGASGPEPCLQSAPCEIEDAIEGSSGTEVVEGDAIVLLPGLYEVGATVLQMRPNTSVGGTRGTQRPTVRGTSTTNFTSVFNSAGNSAGTHLHDVDIVHEGSGDFPAAVRAVQSLERVDALSVGNRAPVGCMASFKSVFRDSVCRATGDQASGLAYAVGCGGVQVLPESRVVNLTVVGSGTRSRGIYLEASGGCDLTIHGSNVIAGGEDADLVAESKDPASETEIALVHSAFDSISADVANESVPAPGSAENISAAPLFVDAAAGNFAQTQASPTIDEGTAADPDLGMFDLNGGPRSAGLAPDIGADEFDPPPPPPDRSAPGTALTDSPKRKTRTTKRRKGVRFEFAANESSTFECKLNRKPWRPCASPYKARLKSKPGKGMRHRLLVRAIDNAGNVDATPARWRGRIIRR